MHPQSKPSNRQGHTPIAVMHDLPLPLQVGPVGIYVDKARSILPALAEPHHAVVLVRLLADEGVIGAAAGG